MQNVQENFQLGTSAPTSFFELGLLATGWNTVVVCLLLSLLRGRMLQDYQGMQCNKVLHGRPVTNLLAANWSLPPRAPVWSCCPSTPALRCSKGTPRSLHVTEEEPISGTWTAKREQPFFLGGGVALRISFWSAPSPREQIKHFVQAPIGTAEDSELAEMALFLFRLPAWGKLSEGNDCRFQTYWRDTELLFLISVSWSELVLCSSLGLYCLSICGCHALYTSAEVVG